MGHPSRSHSALDWLNSMWSPYLPDWNNLTLTLMRRMDAGVQHKVKEKSMNFVMNSLSRNLFTLLLNDMYMLVPSSGIFLNCSILTIWTILTRLRFKLNNVQCWKIVKKLYRFILWNSSEFERGISSGPFSRIGSEPKYCVRLYKINVRF